jgi:hypothetical protein
MGIKGTKCNACKRKREIYQRQTTKEYTGKKENMNEKAKSTEIYIAESQQ